MKNQTKLQRGGFVLAAGLLVMSAGLSARGQSQPNQVEPSQAQTQANQTNQIPDLAPLNLTPDQIQKIRGINAELRDQRRAAGQRLRQAQRALAEAIESATPNETLIDQRSHEVADAQAATIRLRSLTEARILQVLTPEQRIRLKEMRQNQARRRGGNQQFPGKGPNRRQDGMQGNTNTMAPMRPGQRRIIGPQRKP